MVKRSCKRDEKSLRQNFQVVCPTERLLRDLIWWSQEDEDGQKTASMVRGEMLKLSEFLHQIRAECNDPTFWSTTPELPFPEGGVPMSGHPRAPEAFFRLWKISRSAEDGNLSLVPGDAQYEEYSGKENDNPFFKEGDPIYVFNDLPSPLEPGHDNWGDVKFEWLDGSPQFVQDVGTSMVEDLGYTPLEGGE